MKACRKERRGPSSLQRIAITTIMRKVTQMWKGGRCLAFKRRGGRDLPNALLWEEVSKASRCSLWKLGREEIKSIRHQAPSNFLPTQVQEGDVLHYMGRRGCC
jgi:hypothetical protein